MKKLIIIISLILVSSLNLFAEYYGENKTKEMIVVDIDELNLVTEVLVKECNALKQDIKELKKEVEKLKELRGYQK